jgi:hypothetical protein
MQGEVPCQGAHGWSVKLCPDGGHGIHMQCACEHSCSMPVATPSEAVGLRLNFGNLVEVAMNT